MKTASSTNHAKAAALDPQLRQLIKRLVMAQSRAAKAMSEIGALTELIGRIAGGAILPSTNHDWEITANIAADNIDHAPGKLNSRALAKKQNIPLKRWKKNVPGRLNAKGFWAGEGSKAAWKRMPEPNRPEPSGAIRGNLQAFG
jgi:hypothetical protein